jgi:hypothetical protein
MRTGETLTGSKFQYRVHDTGEIIVYPSEKKGTLQAKSAIVITPFTIDLVKSAIVRSMEIAMGASRDNPPTFSLGKIIKDEKQSPQQLSYLIPILVEQALCEVVRQGKSFIVKSISNSNDQD